jgi:hypothetical protein
MGVQGSLSHTDFISFGNIPSSKLTAREWLPEAGKDTEEASGERSTNMYNEKE